jgi:hypothetical protein
LRLCGLGDVSGFSMAFFWIFGVRLAGWWAWLTRCADCNLALWIFWSTLMPEEICLDQIWLQRQKVVAQ